MRRSKMHLRGSVTQNYVSTRMRAREEDGIGFLTRLGLLAGVLIGLLIIAFISWYSGWPQRQYETFKKDFLTLTKKAQFEVKDVTAEGLRLSTKDEVYDALGVKRGTPILSVDLEEAAARLSKLPWVDSVAIERRMPDTIAVVLTERMPVARWQHNEKLAVIDSKGRILPTAKPENFPSLPMLVGTGADRAAYSFLSLLKAYPDIREKMISAVQVSERRWDLHFPPKITVRLPEDGVDNALHRLSVLMAQEKILDRAIVAVDLRIEDRLVLEPAIGAKEEAKKPPEGKKK
jgi:cell division protein FtsQ